MFTRKFLNISLFLVLFGFIALDVVSQIQSNPAREKTWILKGDEAIKMSPPPGKQQTQKELGELSLKAKNRNENDLREVQYWDAGSPAYRWNELGYQLTKPTSFANFNIFLRGPMAWMNMAVYDATAVAWKAKYQYKRKRPHETNASLKPAVTPPATPSYPCEHSVTASAAAHVLAYFFPEKADSILSLAKQAAQSRIDAGVQFPSDVAAGWKLGEQVAALVIDQAKKDGSDKPWVGTMPNDPKLWRGEYPVGITAVNLKPLVIKSANQFRPPAPPDFANDMRALKDFKRNFYSDHLALYWANLSGLDYWTELASKKIFEYNLEKNIPECARIYTLLHVAFHDAAIVIMDAKYAYWGIRPFQYDSTFKPLIETPPFPGYPSGHATASATAAAVLANIFPADAEFFRSKAKECADSRFYGGIHFDTDNKTGLLMGAKLGQYIFDTKAKMDFAGH